MALTAGTNLNSVPTAQKQTLSSNYLDFTGGTDTTWAQQYLPDLMEQEAEVFGNRTISGFLSQVGAEEAMTSDQVVWSEQGRLHLSYTGALVASTGVITISGGHAIRVGQTIVVSDGTTTVKAYVDAVDNSANTIDAN